MERVAVICVVRSVSVAVVGKVKVCVVPWWRMVRVRVSGLVGGGG